ncbi:hypothetical protein CLF_104850 [Clonorchis sinensis]|uniref:Uncharacterized protein n=1 Tax=Clonorchis sinensis TaxID=79923 RepID=G7YCG3_CLOSI|nr:hypothetical protein CLF_104850 [Clonorchis sinensis]
MTLVSLPLGPGELKRDALKSKKLTQNAQEKPVYRLSIGASTTGIKCIWVGRMPISDCSHHLSLRLLRMTYMPKSSPVAGTRLLLRKSVCDLTLRRIVPNVKSGFVVSMKPIWVLSHGEPVYEPPVPEVDEFTWPMEVDQSAVGIPMCGCRVHDEPAVDWRVSAAGKALHSGRKSDWNFLTIKERLPRPLLARFVNLGLREGFSTAAENINTTKECYVSLVSDASSEELIYPISRTRFKLSSTIGNLPKTQRSSELRAALCGALMPAQRTLALIDEEKFVLPAPATSCNTLSVPSRHATRRKHEGWDTTRLPKPRQKSRRRGWVRTTDLPIDKVLTSNYLNTGVFISSSVTRLNPIFKPWKPVYLAAFDVRIQHNKWLLLDSLLDSFCIDVTHEQLRVPDGGHSFFLVIWQLSTSTYCQYIDTDDDTHLGRLYENHTEIPYFSVPVSGQFPRSLAVPNSTPFPFVIVCAREASNSLMPSSCSNGIRSPEHNPSAKRGSKRTGSANRVNKFPNPSPNKKTQSNTNNGNGHAPRKGQWNLYFSFIGAFEIRVRVCAPGYQLERPYQHAGYPHRPIDNAAAEQAKFSLAVLNAFTVYRTERSYSYQKCFGTLWFLSANLIPFTSIGSSIANFPLSPLVLSPTIADTVRTNQSRLDEPSTPKSPVVTSSHAPAPSTLDESPVMISVAKVAGQPPEDASIPSQPDHIVDTPMVQSEPQQANPQTQLILNRPPEMQSPAITQQPFIPLPYNCALPCTIPDCQGCYTQICPTGTMPISTASVSFYPQRPLVTAVSSVASSGPLTSNVTSGSPGGPCYILVGQELEAQRQQQLYATQMALSQMNLNVSLASDCAVGVPLVQTNGYVRDGPVPGSFIQGVSQPNSLQMVPQSIRFLSRVDRPVKSIPEWNGLDGTNGGTNMMANHALVHHRPYNESYLNRFALSTGRVLQLNDLQPDRTSLVNPSRVYAAMKVVHTLCGMLVSGGWK